MAAGGGRVSVAAGLALAALAGLAGLAGLMTPGDAASASTIAAAGTPVQAYPATGLAEVSGMAASVLHPGVVWLVEDSGEPITRAYDPSGNEVGSVTLAGWNNRDTEALAMGPGPTLWVADIGDNVTVRESVVVHTFPEPPTLGASTVEPVSYRLRFPGGPRDAEAVLVDPVDGRLYVATKSLLGRGGLYGAPRTLTAGATHDLVDVTGVPTLVNDGAFSADGSWLVLRRFTGLTLGTEAVVFQPVRDGSGLLTGLDEVTRLQLPDQEQGESIAVASGGTHLLVGSEGATEPIWSVPLPAAVTDLVRAPVTSSAAPDGSSAPPASPVGAVVRQPDDCRLTDPGACTGRAAVWLTAGCALVVLLVGATALGRRRERQRRSTM